MSVSQPRVIVRLSTALGAHLRALGPARAGLVLLSVVGLAGCASSVPVTIRDAPATRLSIASAQQEPDRAIGRQVRWGGSIIAVVNLERSTQIEVLSRPLDGDGEPRPAADGLGRFIAELPGFVDPAEYPKDRLLTVVGPITGVIKRDVGEYPYPYPVVAATSRYLWPEQTVVPYPYYPYRWYGWYGYRPWYGPYGPWYGPAYGPWWW
jgi:outer membrane lipoprotein